MKKIRLIDFEGNIGHISRKAVINTLLENKYIFETPLKRTLRKIYTGLFYIFIGILIALSAYALGNWVGNDTGYKQAIMQIYRGNKEDIAKNKQKAFENISIAGAGADEKIRK